MRHWKSILIPEMMKDLAKDARGYPIPYISVINKDGTPDFKKNDDVKAIMVLAQRRCTICGKKLYKDIWMIGAAISVFRNMGAFIDSFVHEDCGRYSLQVCPFLSTTTYQLSGKESEFKEGVSNRSPFMVFIKITDFEITAGKYSYRYVFPTGPILCTEYWAEGERISEEQARMLFNYDARIQSLIGPGKDFITLPRWAD
jgi:hypothetical protein